MFDLPGIGLGFVTWRPFEITLKQSDFAAGLRITAHRRLDLFIDYIASYWPALIGSPTCSANFVTYLLVRTIRPTRRSTGDTVRCAMLTLTIVTRTGGNCDALPLEDCSRRRASHNSDGL